MFPETEELLFEPMEIIPGAHEIREIILNQKVIEKIKATSHNLIIPELKHEKMLRRFSSINVWIIHRIEEGIKIDAN